MCQQHDSNNGFSTGGTAMPRWQMTDQEQHTACQHLLCTVKTGAAKERLKASLLKLRVLQSCVVAWCMGL